MKACTIWNTPATSSSAPMKMTPAIVNAMTSNQAITPSTSWAMPRATNQPQPVRGRGPLAGGSEVAHATNVNDESCRLATAAVAALVSPRRGAYASAAMIAEHPRR